MDLSESSDLLERLMVASSSAARHDRMDGRLEMANGGPPPFLGYLKCLAAHALAARDDRGGYRPLEITNPRAGNSAPP
jgi:hypothetical protein